MKESNRKIVYIFLAAFMVITFYLIFNAGNPKSLLRIFIEDTSYDITVTLFCGMIIVIMVVLLTSGRRESAIEGLLDKNVEYIRTLRGKGKSDLFIAEDFLKSAGVGKGLIRILAKKRVLRYLYKMDRD
jgi:hypothetical protein